MLLQNKGLLPASVFGAKTGDESKKILEEVGKIVLLPEGEKPTIANITNVEQLKIRQAFFNLAQNGDKLIIYPNKAIIYRPSQKKIVDMAPINLNKDTTPKSETNSVP
jgi:hypothetical protein